MRLTIVGQAYIKESKFEVQAQCEDCRESAIFYCTYGFVNGPLSFEGNLESNKLTFVGTQPVAVAGVARPVGSEVDSRVADIFRQASMCRALGLYDAAGAMCRKAIDVATQQLFRNDARLSGMTAATALRSRIPQLGKAGVLDADMVSIADVAALDGNDAVHDEHPYSPQEAEALEDLTFDLLDRLFVRPARVAAVRAKQVAAGQRKP